MPRSTLTKERHASTACVTALRGSGSLSLARFHFLIYRTVKPATTHICRGIVCELHPLSILLSQSIGTLPIL